MASTQWRHMGVWRTGLENLHLSSVGGQGKGGSTKCTMPWPEIFPVVVAPSGPRSAGEPRYAVNVASR